MGSRKKKGKHGNYRTFAAPYQPFPRQREKKGLSTRIKILLVAVVFVFILIGGVFYWQSSSQPIQSVQYPQTVAGIFFSSPTITSDGTKAALPQTFVNQNKLVFVDLKLRSQINEFTYQGRTIPLSVYKSGRYLPLVIIFTPLQKVISAIRVCEPCSSFSFHIVQARYLQCDLCGTRWDIETLVGVSGACPNYPPLKLTSLVSSNIEIDLSPLGITVIP